MDSSDVDSIKEQLNKVVEYNEKKKDIKIGDIVQTHEESEDMLSIGIDESDEPKRYFGVVVDVIEQKDNTLVEIVNGGRRKTLGKSHLEKVLLDEPLPADIKQAIENGSLFGYNPKVMNEYGLMIKPKR